MHPPRGTFLTLDDSLITCLAALCGRRVHHKGCMCAPRNHRRPRRACVELVLALWNWYSLFVEGPCGLKAKHTATSNSWSAPLSPPPPPLPPKTHHHTTTVRFVCSVICIVCRTVYLYSIVTWPSYLLCAVLAFLIIPFLPCAPSSATQSHPPTHPFTHPPDPSALSASSQTL